jgi:DNA-binding response OmpR family regulator
MTVTTDTASEATTDVVDVLLYSDDVTTREEVRRAVGRRPAKDLPKVRWTETATHPATVRTAEEGSFSLLILDGEAAKAGGMAVSKQLKNELYECPPVLVLTARPQDAWLAASCEADAVVQVPLDPIELQRVVARMLRGGEADAR